MGNGVAAKVGMLENRVSELEKSITKVVSSMDGLTTTLQGLVTDRAVREAIEKRTRNLYLTLITVAGVIVPLVIAVMDHLLK